MKNTHANTGISRRAFIAGCMAAGAVGCSTAKTARKGELDPYAIGVISDIHTGLPWGKQEYRTGMEYPWMPAAAERLVADILALPNPPANIIGLGDISLAFGEKGDYEVAAKVLKPLADAGIKVTHAMGNHAIRAEFLKYFPGYDKTTKVPGRFVSVVNTPHVDFILLDSLVEPTKRGDYQACTGLGLGKEQTEWLSSTLAAATKPTFVCAHHKANDLKINYVFKERRAGDVPMCYADPSRAEKELGWKAVRDLETMCRDSWRWQKNNPNGYENTDITIRKKGELV